MPRRPVPFVRRGAPALLAGALAGSVLLAAPSATAVAPSAPATERAQPATPGDLRRITRQLVRAGAVGVSAEVVVDGRTYRMAAGRSQVEPTRSARPDARFRAASVTKQLTTVMALQQVEAGTWSLDTTIGDVLPGLWPERADVTVEQLLSHRSGMPDYLPPMVAGADTNAAFVRIVSQRRTDRELVGIAKRQPWLFEPGTDYGYANTNFVVVGMMLRAQTGTPLPVLARRSIFRPAAMTRSAWGVKPGLPAPRLREYARLGGLVDLNRFDPTMFSSAGALVTTARDLNRFQAALNRGDLVERSLVRTMRRPLTEGGSTAPSYGLGSYRLPNACRDGGPWLHGHDGASWGTQTMSFTGTGSGAPRVAIAMTGRPYGLERIRRVGTLMLRFVTTASEIGCTERRPGGVPSSATVTDRLPSLRVAPPLG